MLKNNCSSKQGCSVKGMLHENDVVQIVVDGYSWNSRVENASCANLGLVEVCLPVLPVLKGQIKVSTPDTAVVLLVPSNEALFIMNATVVGTGVDKIKTITLRIDEVEAIQRRSTPRAKTVLPVSIRKAGSHDWEHTKSVDISTGGLHIASDNCSKISAGEMLDVTIAQRGSAPIVFAAKVVDCKDDSKYAAQNNMMRLAIDNVDTRNWQALYRLVQPRLNQTGCK